MEVPDREWLSLPENPGLLVYCTIRLDLLCRRRYTPSQLLPVSDPPRDSTLDSAKASVFGRSSHTAVSEWFG